jgi:hypothetical protein
VDLVCQGDTVLVKGSRGVGLERAIERLRSELAHTGDAVGACAGEPSPDGSGYAAPEQR